MNLYSKYIFSISVVIASIITIISLAIINPVYFIISLFILFMYTELLDWYIDRSLKGSYLY